MPITRFLSVNPVDLIPSPTKLSVIGGIFSQMYIFNQAIAYPQSLHIGRATDIKMVSKRPNSTNHFGPVAYALIVLWNKWILLPFVLAPKKKQV